MYNENHVALLHLSEVAKNKDGASNISIIISVIITLFFEDLNLAEIAIEINESPVTNMVP